MNKNKLILMLCAIGIAFSMSTKVSASNNTQRIWGNDRYATAIEVSKNGWADGSEYAVLANGENFPDALSAAPLAKKYNAPILLNPGAALDSRVEAELKRLGVKQIFIVGGSAVVPDTVRNKLEQLNIKTTRLWGKNRYETSIKIAEQLDFNGQVAVANGEGFADALSISPIAAQKSMPVILTPPNTLPDATAKYIKSNNITKTYIIGESDVVGDNIANSFPNSERIWGGDKYGTNAAVLSRFKDELNFSNTYIASGENFPDALSGSALSAKNSSAIALVNGSLEAINNTNTKGTIAFLSQNGLNPKSLNVLGGNGVINDTLVYRLAISQFENANSDGYFKPYISDVVIDEDWVYYYKESCTGDEAAPLGKSAICKIKKDLTEYTSLVDTTIYGENPKYTENTHHYIIKIEDGWIYYDSLYSSFKVKIDGTENTCLGAL